MASPIPSTLRQFYFHPADPANWSGCRRLVQDVWFLKRDFSFDHHLLRLALPLMSMESEQHEIALAKESESWRAPSFPQRLSARESPRGRPVMRQRWSKLLFLHWPIEAAFISSRLPKGLHVDLFDGTAWIGIVPFSMERVHPVGLPPLPWISWFLELNVRTYVHDDAGRPGVWFFSLDCNQPVAVEIARRLFHLPYNHARMCVDSQGRDILYSSQRKGSQSISRYRYRLPAAAKPARDQSLEWFLVERYLLFTSDRANRIRCGRVHHNPYLVEQADCSDWTVEPIRENGFPAPCGNPVSALVAEPVDVNIYPLELNSTIGGKH